MKRTLRGGGEVSLAEASPTFTASVQWFRDDASDYIVLPMFDEALAEWEIVQELSI